MRKKMRKFLRQINAKKHGFGAITIMILMILVAFSSTLIIILPEQVKADPGYGDYSNYKMVTIESDYIETDLDNFPILVNDNTGDLLGTVLANGSDIAFYDSTNITWFNHEIEEYNSTTGELLAWVNVTSVASGSDTVLYMYYGDNDGGYPIGHNPTGVWDTNFVFVGHLNESTTQTNGCYDFTANANHGTYVGSLPTNVAGKVGIGQDFDGTGDRIDLPSGTFIDQVGTFECMHESDATGETDYLFQVYQDDSNRHWTVMDSIGTYTFAYYKAASFEFNIASGTRDTSYHYVASAFTTNDAELRLDTDSLGTDGDVVVADWSFTAVTIGAKFDGTSEYDGVMDEVRVSDIRRSNAWLNASFYSGNQTSGFITLGIEEGEGTTASSHNIKGLQNNRVTWSGIAGITVWCNETGDFNEWLEINMSINATDNVTEIRVWIGDMNDSGVYINASNITMYVSDHANSTYQILNDNQHGLGNGIFPDGGGNLSINSTNWPGGCDSDPFSGVGLTNINTSIFCIFKMTIPATAITDDYYNSVASKIYIGRYT